jgi:hypothetical protein
VLDRGLETGRPKLALLMAVGVAAATSMAVTLIGGEAGFGGYCVADRTLRAAASCPSVGPWTLILVSALPGLIVAYLFSRPSNWPTAGALWCLPFLAAIGAVRCLELALAPADAVAWPWLAGVPVCAVLAIGLVVRWARGHAEREGAGIGAGLALIACIPIGVALGFALTALVS